MTEDSDKIHNHNLGDSPEENLDPWKDFRLIEILDLEWTQTYRHSLGKYSRFFRELKNKRIFGTKCSECNKVWLPPRPLCPDCLTITKWHELSGRGRLATFSVLHYAPSMAAYLETPYVLAYVKLDGADTLFAHLLLNYSSLDEVEIGMPVKVVFQDGPVDHPIHLMAFVPDR